MSDKTPMERFKDFVATILTVTKEDVQKMEAETADVTGSDRLEPEE
jgi:hypothetical protein